MTGLFIMLGGMVLFAVVVAVFDWLGERQRRHRTRERHP